METLSLLFVPPAKGGGMEIFMKKNRVLGLISLLVLSFVLISSLSVSAEHIYKDDKDKPIDLVIVMDKSGSMLESDPQKMTSAAVNMLINMMPAEGSRVGVVAFNDESEILTTVGASTKLIPLIDLGNVLAVKDQVRNVVYHGGTAIGNALKMATDILAQESNSDHQKVIMLFTDGVNDFGDDKEALANCEDNETDAVIWAKDNDCKIYCFGYDYQLSDGTSSMGTNGEGVLKLSKISDMTGGQTTRIENINTVQDEFIKMLIDLCDLIYVDVATVPGDGGKHEVTFEVGPSVLEANIRIGSITQNAISNGSFVLYDPNGNAVELKNDENVRYDVDSLAASIKIIRPQIGQWVLELDGIVGDDIKIGLLEHYRISVGAEIVLPDGNPEGVAFTNDEVLVKAWLNEDEKKNEDAALYDSITKASAMYIPRAHPDSIKTIDLKRNGLGFEGSFVIEEECIYDVQVKIESGTFYRETSLTIESSNHPLELVSDIGDVDVNVKKSVVVKDIYSKVTDAEGDEIVAEVSMIGNPDSANVYVNGKDLVIEAKEWKSTFATVTYKDKQGNTVETSFKITIHNPWFFIGGALTIVVIALIVLLLIVLALEKSRNIKGYITLASILKTDLTRDHEVVDTVYEYSEDAGIKPSYICKLNLYGLFGKRKNLKTLIDKIAKDYEKYLRDNDPSIMDEMDNPISNCLATYFDELMKYEVKGTVGGLKGFIIKLPSKSKVYMESYKNHKGKVKINRWPKNIIFVSPMDTDEEGNCFAYELKLRYTNK